MSFWRRRRLSRLVICFLWIFFGFFTFLLFGITLFSFFCLCFFIARFAFWTLSCFRFLFILRLFVRLSNFLYGIIKFFQLRCNFFFSILLLLIMVLVLSCFKSVHIIDWKLDVFFHAKIWDSIVNGMHLMFGKWVQILVTPRTIADWIISTFTSSRSWKL